VTCLNRHARGACDPASGRGAVNELFFGAPAGPSSRIHPLRASASMALSVRTRTLLDFDTVNLKVLVLRFVRTEQWPQRVGESQRPVSIGMIGTGQKP